MKIEKINDNQVRFTLTREDLADRNIKLSELAYGSANAKMLFRDMMQQANYEVGFEADDIPLMIEAVPMSKDTIVLIVTKVEYPEELDTRFSKFSESPDYEDFAMPVDMPPLESANDILNFFKNMRNIEKSGEAADKDDKHEEMPFVPLKDTVEKKESDTAKDKNIDFVKMFAFNDLDTIIRLAKILSVFELERNTIYHDVADRTYHLIIHKGDLEPEDFNRICNIFAEYSKPEVPTPATESFFNEHMRIIGAGNALQMLAKL